MRLLPPDQETVAKLKNPCGSWHAVASDLVPRLQPGNPYHRGSAPIKRGWSLAAGIPRVDPGNEAPRYGSENSPPCDASCYDFNREWGCATVSQVRGRNDTSGRCHCEEQSDEAISSVIHMPRLYAWFRALPYLCHRVLSDRQRPFTAPRVSVFPPVPGLA